MRRSVLFPVFVWLAVVCGSVSLSADPGAFAEEIEERGPVRIYATRVEELLDASDDSPYVRLLKYLTRNLQKDLNLQIMPYRRAVRSFLKDPQSCLYIANEGFNYEPYGSPDLSGVRYSKPINRLRIKFFVHAGRTPPGSLEALRGLSIAAESGAYSIVSSEPVISGRAQLMVMDSLQAALALLGKGRVDAVAVYGLDLAQYEAQHGEQDVVAHPEFGIGDIYEQIACWQGGTRTALLDLVDSEIDKAVEDGQWRRILGKGAEDPGNRD
ncbi:transporter substrate-binding domain-containing protein [Pseudokordiimonas caeni]|uniref:transporter substrate-binding domain-containing protein n=1 Tax=Pseudokordiimonas caeni TaxID=2997908 RepID=UPI00281131FE|nr:transporter substrate-binding domain-containing protein [Pseudokordiimonas caeni]